MCDHCEKEAYDEYREAYPDAKYCMYCGRYVLPAEFHKVTPIEKVVREQPMKDVEMSHPSFIQISVTRFQGGNPNYYGSNITHDHGISIKVSRSKLFRDEYNDHYYPYQTLLEFRLSPAQFTEMLTTMNVHEGVPATLTYLRGEVIPSFESESIQERLNQDLSRKLKELANRFSEYRSEIEAILDKKGTILKKDRQALRKLYGLIEREFASNLPFLHKCMTETLDRSVLEAKTEIEAFYMHSVMNEGRKALENESKKEITR